MYCMWSILLLPPMQSVRSCACHNICPTHVKFWVWDIFCPHPPSQLVCVWRWMNMNTSILVWWKSVWSQNSLCFWCFKQSKYFKKFYVFKLYQDKFLGWFSFKMRLIPRLILPSSSSTSTSTLAEVIFNFTFSNRQPTPPNRPKKYNSRPEKTKSKTYLNLT